MATKKDNLETALSENERICQGTAMLRKRRQMTQEQAHHAGKLGRADLHMHSTYSDGLATIEQILHRVQHHTNLDVIALTDHVSARYWIASSPAKMFGLTVSRRGTPAFVVSAPIA